MSTPTIYKLSIIRPNVNKCIICVGKSMTTSSRCPLENIYRSPKQTNMMRILKTMVDASRQYPTDKVEEMYYLLEIVSIIV